MRVRILMTILIIFSCDFFTHAQVGSAAIGIEGGLSTFWNPALNPKTEGLHLWIGEVKSSLYNSSFALEDVVSNSEGKNLVNFKDVVDRVRASNRAVVEAVLHTIGIDWRQDKFSIGLGHRVRYIGNFTYSDEFIQLVHQGNAGFLGQEIDVGPGFSYFHYNEIYLDAAFKMKGLSIGGRVKVLAGSEYMGTKDSRIRLRTLEDYYSLQFSNNYLIQSSGIFYYNGLNDVMLDFDPVRLQSIFSENKGWAIDLGMVLELSEKTRVMASFSDLGSITWDKNTSTYVSEGDILYDGINILDYVADNESVVISDSLYQLLEFQETKDIDFTTHIPWQWTLGFSSDIQRGNRVSFFVYGNSINSVNQLSLLAGYHKNWTKVFSTSLSYTLTGRSYNNLGLTALFDFDSVGFYIGLDNLINTVRPFGTNYGGFQFGLQAKF